MTDEYDDRIEVVETGQPSAQFVACRSCGVLLWDINSHWANAHANDEAHE